MKSKALFSIFTAVCVLILALPVLSQSITSGDLAGVVSDPTGAVVPNAKVTATNDNTAAAHTTTTNGEGFYRFSFLQPGPYTIAINAGGF